MVEFLLTLLGLMSDFSDSDYLQKPKPRPVPMPTPEPG